MKKYFQFLQNNLFETKNSDAWDLEKIDPFGEEDWDEIDEEKPPMVIDYYGDLIPEDDAVWCDDESVWIHQDEAMWSESSQMYFTPNNNDYIWVDTRYGGDYIHSENLVFLERDGEYHIMDDVVWCKHDDDYCLNEDAVECDDGDYAFKENVVEDSEGRIQHTDDVVWDEETEEYILTE